MFHTLLQIYSLSRQRYQETLRGYDLFRFRDVDVVEHQVGNYIFVLEQASNNVYLYNLISRQFTLLTPYVYGMEFFVRGSRIYWLTVDQTILWGYDTETDLFFETALLFPRRYQFLDVTADGTILYKTSFNLNSISTPTSLVAIDFFGSSIGIGFSAAHSNISACVATVSSGFTIAPIISLYFSIK